MTRLLFTLFVLFSQEVYAQVETVTAEFPFEPSLTTKNYYRPQFSDTTLLFFSDSLVWTCTIGDGFQYSFYKVDFFKVTECECFEEVYQRLPARGNPNHKGYWDNYRYEILQKEKRAELKRVSATSLEYKEFNRFGNLTRTQKLIYDPAKIIFVDSVYAENSNLQLYLTVSRWVEVKNK